MESKFENYVSLFNEMTVSVYLYVIMILNLFMQGDYPPSYRDTCGIVLVSLVIASLGVNLLVFLVQIILMVRLKFLKWYYSRKDRVQKEPVEETSLLPEIEVKDVPIKKKEPAPVAEALIQPIEEFFAYHIDDELTTAKKFRERQSNFDNTIN